MIQFEENGRITVKSRKASEYLVTYLICTDVIRIKVSVFVLIRRKRRKKLRRPSKVDSKVYELYHVTSNEFMNNRHRYSMPKNPSNRIYHICVSIFNEHTDILCENVCSAAHIMRLFRSAIYSKVRFGFLCSLCCYYETMTVERHNMP